MQNSRRTSNPYFKNQNSTGRNHYPKKSIIEFQLKKHEAEKLTKSHRNENASKYFVQINKNNNHKKHTILNKKDNILNSLYTPRKEILDIELKNHQNEKSEIELKDQSSCILEKSLNVNLSLEKKIEMIIKEGIIFKKSSHRSHFKLEI